MLHPLARCVPLAGMGGISALAQPALAVPPPLAQPTHTNPSRRHGFPEGALAAACDRQPRRSGQRGRWARGRLFALEAMRRRAAQACLSPSSAASCAARGCQPAQRMHPRQAGTDQARAARQGRWHATCGSSLAGHCCPRRRLPATGAASLPRRPAPRRACPPGPRQQPRTRSPCHCPGAKAVRSRRASRGGGATSGCCASPECAAELCATLARQSAAATKPITSVPARQGAPTPVRRHGGGLPPPGSFQVVPPSIGPMGRGSTPRQRGCEGPGCCRRPPEAEPQQRVALQRVPAEGSRPRGSTPRPAPLHDKSRQLWPLVRQAARSLWLVGPQQRAPRSALPAASQPTARLWRALRPQPWAPERLWPHAPRPSRVLRPACA